MKLKAYIVKTNAIAAGSNECGDVEKEVDISVLSEEERRTLTGAIEWQSDRIAKYNQGILDLEHLRVYLAERIAEKKKQQAEMEQKNREQLETFERNLAERKTYQEKYRVENGRLYVDYTTERFDYGLNLGYVPTEWLDRPEAKAFREELERRNHAAKTTAESRLTKMAEERDAAEQAVLNARNAWIAEHGSRRLKVATKEGIECEAIYRDERLALERPGWVWASEMDGNYSDPRNPTEKAIDLLEDARKTEPAAQLVYWERDADEDEDGNEIEAWRGYCALAEFLGRKIVFGLPSDLRA